MQSQNPGKALLMHSQRQESVKEGGGAQRRGSINTVLVTVKQSQVFTQQYVWVCTAWVEFGCDESVVFDCLFPLMVEVYIVVVRSRFAIVHAKFAVGG
jgi:hypothetical protein